MVSTDGSERVVDYRIAPAVLESIVRGSLTGDPRVRAAHGVSRSGRHPVDVGVKEGACLVTVHVHALLGEDLVALGGRVRTAVGTRLSAMTGMPVGHVDVHIDGVFRAPASESEGADADASG